MSSFDDWLREQADLREKLGLTRRLVDADRGDPLLDLAGNDYLGLARDPRVVAAAADAARRYGAGAGASRLVSGTLTVHTALEKALAEFTGYETALVFSTGYHANLSAVAALADADTLVVSDAHIHASLVDACRLSRAALTVVPHNDVSAVEAALSGRSQPRALVLAETVYSVLGDAAPVDRLAALCSSYDAVLVADEAHALGVVGAEGRGLLHSSGLGGRRDVVATVTLSKSLGAQGGAVLCSRAVREHLVNRARPFVYDTGLAPAAAGAAREALRVIGEEPDRVARVRANAATLAAACRVAAPDGAVLSVSMPGPREAVAAVATAAACGVRIGCFRPPSTPDGISRLRLTAHAHHTDDELRLATKVLGELLGELPGVTVYVVTGTDTEVGKTVVTAALAVVLRGRGRTVAVVKPAQTGVAPGEPGDVAEVTRLAGEVDTFEGARLPDPLAPDTAAALAGAELPSLCEQRDLALRAAASHDDVLVEGSGGVAVNLGRAFTLLDLAVTVVDAGQDVRVLVVARSGLGTLNHSTLTVWAVQARGLPVLGLVIGSWPGAPGLADRHNRDDLARVTGVPVLGAVPEGAGSWEPDAFRAQAAGWLPVLSA